MGKRRAFFRFISFFLVIFIFLYVDYLGLRNLFRYNGFKKELNNKRSELAELMVINQGYKQTILSMQRDDFWILEIKKNLGYIQKGEKVYKFYK